MEKICVTELIIDQLVIARGTRRVLDGITLRVGNQERVAVIGPNGAGKTTLMRAILGLIPVQQGSILLDGVPTGKLSPLERAAQLAWLPQQALVEEPITALEFVQAARYRFQEPHQIAREAALRALQRAGAEQWAQSLITRISGGEQQRVALAALFAQEATVLLADEPANHLDPAQQVSAWTLLGQAACAGSILVITHDINLVPLLGDPSQTRIVALNRGRLVFDVPASESSLPERLRELYGIEMRAYGQAASRVIVPRGPGESCT
jgi:iron complex transport system ATP-binding protein